MISVEDLKKFDVFIGWTEDELKKIIPYMEEKELEKNTVLFEQNSPAEMLYFVRSGCIELELEVANKSEAKLARVKSGNMFGEMSIFDNKTRSAKAVAFIDTNLIGLNKDEIYEFIDQSGKDLSVKLLVSIIKRLSQLLRSANDEIRNIKSYG